MCNPPIRVGFTVWDSSPSCFLVGFLCLDAFNHCCFPSSPLTHSLPPSFGWVTTSDHVAFSSVGNLDRSLASLFLPFASDDIAIVVICVSLLRATHRHQRSQLMNSVDHANKWPGALSLFASSSSVPSPYLLQCSLSHSS